MVGKLKVLLNSILKVRVPATSRLYCILAAQAALKTIPVPPPAPLTPTHPRPPLTESESGERFRYCGNGAVVRSQS